MILTVCFANQKVALESYTRLHYTSDQVVWLWDNHYPGTDARGICKQFGFKYHSAGENIGLYEAHNRMIAQIEHADKVIMYDSDNYPIQHEWDEALLKVLGGDVVHATLMNHISHREMHERGYTRQVINGYNCMVTKEAVTNTTCGFMLDFLKEFGGIFSPHKYYGGNEIAMWQHYKGRKWVFLDDFHEDSERLKKLHDWQYEQYKLLYAHRGLGMSFDEYLDTKPERVDDLAKQIFG